MKDIVDVAIIGAGPYALSLAAHLRETGLSFRIFGKPLSTWTEHMPDGMKLKSDGFASNLYAPAANSTLKAYCTHHGIAYHDTDIPVRLDVFNAYAEAFMWRFAPNVEAKDVMLLQRKDDDFLLLLENGERAFARHVVLAVGITAFADMPEELKRIPKEYRSHSFHHKSARHLHRREVVVIGGGASAIDIAAQLAENDVSVRIVTRDRKIRWHNPPGVRHALSWLTKPMSGIGPGWRSLLCTKLPELFHALPQSLRLRAVRRHLGPAPAWFMRARVDGRIPITLDSEVIGATMRGRRVSLTIASKGEEGEIQCDYVIAATGYKTDMSRLSFLEQRLLSQIEQAKGTPVLSSQFETTVRGLYVIGPAAANSFGPMMRFMVGAGYTSPRLTKHLSRRLKQFKRPAPVASRTLRPA